MTPIKRLQRKNKRTIVRSLCSVECRIYNVHVGHGHWTHRQRSKDSHDRNNENLEILVGISSTSISMPSSLAHSCVRAEQLSCDYIFYFLRNYSFSPFNVRRCDKDFAVLRFHCSFFIYIMNWWIFSSIDSCEINSKRENIIPFRVSC